MSIVNLEKINIEDFPYKIEKERIVINLVNYGNPVAKQRPRFCRRGNAVFTYTPKETKKAEEEIGWLVKSKYKNLICDSENIFGMRALFYTKDKRKKDVDNILKIILDSCNKIVWNDDKQCEEVYARIFRADPNPRTEFIIYKI